MADMVLSDTSRKRSMSYWINIRFIFSLWIYQIFWFYPWFNHLQKYCFYIIGYQKIFSIWSICYCYIFMKCRFEILWIFTIYFFYLMFFEMAYACLYFSCIYIVYKILCDGSKNRFQVFFLLKKYLMIE